MIFAIISDTHGYVDNVIDFLYDKDIDFFIHAGDFSKDAMEIADVIDKKYYVCRGNNDYFDHKSKKEVVIKTPEHRIFLTHGHNYAVDLSLHNLTIKAKENNCDIAIFGHIHRYVNEMVDGVRILNPGSSSLPRDNVRSIMLVEEIGKRLEIKRIIL